MWQILICFPSIFKSAIERQPRREKRDISTRSSTIKIGVIARFVAVLDTGERIGTPAMSSATMALLRSKLAIAGTLRHIATDPGSPGGGVFCERTLASLGVPRRRCHNVTILCPALAKAGAVGRRRMALQALVVAVRGALRNQPADGIARGLLTTPMLLTSGSSADGILSVDISREKDADGERCEFQHFEIERRMG